MNDEIIYDNKKILITGGAVTIGSNITKKLVNKDINNIVLLDKNENDLYLNYRDLQKNTRNNTKVIPIIANIRDQNRIKDIFLKYKPDIIIHTAALKQVPLLEENPKEAFKTNIEGTLNLIEESNNIRANYFIYISTDKAVNPTNIMGATKRIGEIILNQYPTKTKKIAVRLGNVYGSAGSVVPIFKQQINEGGPITITHEKAKRFFITISKATDLILEAINLGKDNELFVLNMGEQRKIKEIAKELCEEYGLELKKDLKVDYIGLREGEKIKEELFYEEEKIEMTEKENIYSLKQIQSNIDILNKIKEIDKFIKNNSDDNQIRKMIFRLVNECNNNLDSKNDDNLLTQSI